MDIAATLEAFYNKVDLLYLTDVIGIVAFAFAGVLIGIRMKCDPVGIFVLAFSTAFGGGIVRDLLIDRRPMYWIANQELVWLVLLITIFTPMIFRFYKKHLSYDVFVWSDARFGLFLRSRYQSRRKPRRPLPACRSLRGGNRRIRRPLQRYFLKYQALFNL